MGRLAEGLIGRTIGGYRIVATIGAGGMGTVYRAVQERLDAPVALKVLRGGSEAEERAVARFEREARAIAQLRGRTPHVVQVYDHGADAETGVYWIAMEYVDGESLGAVLARVGRLAPPLAVRVTRQAGLVHRDVKPDNLLLTPDGCVKVADFGLVRPLAGGASVTGTGQVVGTLAYMAPEQAMGDTVDHRADLYSLGATLFALLTGQPPHGAVDGERALFETLMQLVTAPVPELRVAGQPTSAALEALVRRCLARDPAERPATAGALATALDAWLAAEDPDAARPDHAVLAGLARPRPAPATDAAAPMIANDGPATRATPTPPTSPPALLAPSSEPPVPAAAPTRRRATRRGAWALATAAAVATGVVAGVVLVPPRGGPPTERWPGPSAPAPPRPAVDDSRVQAAARRLEARREARARAATLLDQAVRDETEAAVTDTAGDWRGAAELADQAAQAAADGDEPAIRDRARTLAGRARARADAADARAAADARRLARRTAYDRAVTDARKETDPGAALKAWRTADEVADDPTDKATCTAGIKACETALAEATPEWRCEAALRDCAAALDRGDLDTAGVKLAAAADLFPDAPEVAEMRTRLASARKAKVRTDAITAATAHEGGGRFAEARDGWAKLLATAQGDREARAGWRRAVRRLGRVSVVCDPGAGGTASFVLVPGGAVTLGDPAGEPDEAPRAVVLSRDCWVQTTEVTQAQWLAVLGKNPSAYGSEVASDWRERPVDQVSWQDAEAYAARLTTRLEGPLAGWRVTLPTEAEWEHACRAGRPGRWSFGDDATALAAYGWFGDKEAGTHPVARKQPNALGLYDMHGNVWEWCADWYAAAPAGGRDPAGPPRGELRALRGGAFPSEALHTRSAVRASYPPDQRLTQFGCRVVLREPAE